MNDDNVMLIERFYRAFDDGEGETMAACYAPNVRFSDPALTELRGERAGARGIPSQPLPPPLAGPRARTALLRACGGTVDARAHSLGALQTTGGLLPWHRTR